MMELGDALTLGFSVAFTPENLMYCFIGCLVGTLIGVLPGLGPVPTMALLLPLTFGIDPIGAIVMLAGIYYGAQYGGSTTAILANLPGETSSTVSCIDGYKMAMLGRAGAALFVAAIGSFFAGSVATLVIALFSPALATIAIQFGPEEYFALMVLGLIAAIVLARGSFLKAVGMLVAGLFLGLVGTDVNSGEDRFTFGILALSNGIDFVVIAMGLFGIAEILTNLTGIAGRGAVLQKVGRLLPSLDEFNRALMPILRGSVIGTILGVLPGGGAVLSSFAAYSIEKRVSRTPERFGKGAIEGVAAPECANNAGAQTSFIPLLTLGIPGNAVMAMMLGALMIHGISPGPLMMSEQPKLFWGVIASMWIGNFMLVVLNLPLIGIWVRLLQVPYRWLYPAILLVCCVGVYSINASEIQIVLTAMFGLVGYILRRLECDPAPLLLGFVLGPLLEENLRRSLLYSRGDALVFFERPISLALLLVALACLIAVIVPTLRQRREVVFKES